MSTAFDALPAIVPFFGVLLSSFTVGFCCMNRRISRLQNRIEQLEIQRVSPPQVVIEAARPPPPPVLTPPIYSSYPIQQQQQQYTYPYYQQQPIPSTPYQQNTI